MKVTYEHRQKLEAFLKKFYSYYPDERFTIFHFVKYLKERCRGYQTKMRDERGHRIRKGGKDAWVGVAGDTGLGKSYGVLTAMVLFGRPMSLEDNVAYIPTGQQMYDMFNKMRFQCLLVDEAGREMRAVNWQSKQQQLMNVTAMTERFKNNVVFMCMPNFNEFTKSMRRGNLHFRLIALYRTDQYVRFVVQKKKRNWRSDDPWFDEHANKIYEKAERKHKELDNDTILSIERSLPNTIMDFIIPDLSLALPEITSEYERLKMASREEKQVEEKGAKRNKYKDLYYEMARKLVHLIEFNEIGVGQKKVSRKEASDYVGVSESTFSKWKAEPIVKDNANFREKGAKEANT